MILIVLWRLLNKTGICGHHTKFSKKPILGDETVLNQKNLKLIYFYDITVLNIEVKQTSKSTREEV